MPTTSLNDTLHRTSAQAIHTLGPTGTLTLVLFLLPYVGVVLPAVRSHHAYRRTAARRTMTILLDHAGNPTRLLRTLLHR